MHVLIAPNAFKHALSASAAADALARGLGASAFQGTWETCPIGDGGDGTALLLLEALGGRRITIAAHDALGTEVSTQVGLLDDSSGAVLELAEASGLKRLATERLDPLHATTYGTGELIRAVLDHGRREIILCVGGSAAVDGGTGILRALGIKFIGAAGEILDSMPRILTDLASIDASGLDRRLADGSLTLLCDVDNGLTGPRGAAAVFGPQKGADVRTVDLLDEALARFAEVVRRHNGVDLLSMTGGGAAGGAAAGLAGLVSARLVNGIDYFLERVGFDRRLENADIVVTGEGSIDDQTVDGKGPWGVAWRAKRSGAFVIGLAGRVPVNVDGPLRAAFDVLLPIGHRVQTVTEALELTAPNLARTGFEIGNLLALAARR